MFFQVCLLFLRLTQIGSTAEIDYKKEFKTFKALYGKQYTAFEEKQRLYNFKVNRDSNEQLKFKPNLEAKFGVTKFWDLSIEEFKDNPQSLINTMWLYNTIHFGLRGRQEHTDMLWGDFERGATATGRKYIMFTERATKTRNGVASDTRQFMPKMFEQPDLYLSDILVHGNHSGNTETNPDRFKHLGIPDKLDWRTKLNHNVISPIKNQKKCGACWAFSTVETIESMYAIQSGVSVPSLSVQEVIDCATNNYGCRGGDTCRALEWMTDTKPALVQDSKYPLTDESNQCKIIADPSGAVYVQNFTCDSYVGKEDQILLMLQAGPVAAAVDATTWYNYQGGIIQYHCGVYDNHAIQIIGYDLTSDVPHYIIRNSWGTDFGNGGYVYVKIGGNVCGIASRVSSVYVKI